MTGWIIDAVLPLAIRVVGGLTRHLSARCDSGVVVGSTSSTRTIIECVIASSAAGDRRP